MKKTLFQERHSLALRIWHWSSAFVIMLLFFTIFVSKTFLNGMHADFVIHHAARNTGLSAITDNDVYHMVMFLRETIWKWHTRFGYILAGLFAGRLLLEFLQPREQWFNSRVKAGFVAVKQKGGRKSGKHYLLVKLIYLIFYLLLLAMIISGIWMALNRNNSAVTPDRFHSVKEIHEACFNLLLLFILIHIAGVIKGEKGRHRNIVSGMINGGYY